MCWLGDSYKEKLDEAGRAGGGFGYHSVERERKEEEHD